ncbi:MAG: hypothetical protein R2786_11695, partial [Flavobacteriaceae bacterium]
AWCTSSCVWRASVIHQVSWLSTRIWEDYAFDVDVALKNNNVIGTKEKYVYYDASGDDKLSGVVDDATILEKSKSLQYVSKLLQKNFSKRDKKISGAIRKHLLNQLIQLLGMKNKAPLVIKENEAALRYWGGPLIGGYIQFTSLLNLKLRVALLRKIRRKLF